ncbi:MAG: DUF2975 domain-containing protein [Deltaproteobacteria bacterium]|nr:DUF2975 domain-containing protein [Deltaproteobacteria bacterium]
MDNSRRITTLSIKLRRICTGLIYCLPIVCGLIWIFFNRLYAMAPMMPLPVHVNHDLPGLTRLLAFLADLIPLSAMIFGLKKLRSLFFLYENGLIFTEQNVSCFRSLGRTLIVWAACDVVRTTLLSVILTLDNPPGRRIIAVMFDSGDFTGVFVGVVVLIISWVMDEGRKIQEDQALIV